MRAARLFDESREHNFSDFASFEIQCSIRDFLFRNRIIRLPDDQRSKINKYQTTLRQLEVSEANVSSATQDKLAKDLGLLKEVHVLITSPMSSLNATTNEGNSEMSDIIADDTDRIENAIDNIQFKELVSFIRGFFKRAMLHDVDEKTGRIVLKQLDAYINKSLGNDDLSFKDIVSAEFPDLDVKGIEFDRQYTRISGVWREYLNMCRNRLVWSQFI